MNAKCQKPRTILGLCPKCGMDGGKRMVSENNPLKCYIVCETCGFVLGPYKDFQHVTREWNKRTLK